jgi:predicted nucleotidyltransferase
VTDTLTSVLDGCHVTPDELLALEHLADAPADVTAFISGSLFEGLGNKTSDIDVYVIGQAKPRSDVVIHKKNIICIAKHELAGRRVDVEFWHPHAVQALAARLDGVTVERDLDALACEEIDFIHRVRMGFPLLREPLFKEWQRRFDYEKLVRLMRHRAWLNVTDVLEDLEGMLDNQDLDVALIRCHDLLADTCDYTLRCAGETNPKRKWGPKLLAKYDHVPFVREVRLNYLSLQLPDQADRIRTDPETAMRYARTCMALARRVLDATGAR